jgi:hypothetical protein
MSNQRLDFRLGSDLCVAQPSHIPGEPGTHKLPRMMIFRRIAPSSIFVHSRAPLFVSFRAPQFDPSVRSGINAGSELRSSFISCYLETHLELNGISFTSWYFKKKKKKKVQCV